LNPKDDDYSAPIPQPILPVYIPVASPVVAPVSKGAGYDVESKRGKGKGGKGKGGKSKGGKGKGGKSKGGKSKGGKGKGGKSRGSKGGPDCEGEKYEFPENMLPEYEKTEVHKYEKPHELEYGTSKSDGGSNYGSTSPSDDCCDCFCENGSCVCDCNCDEAITGPRNDDFYGEWRPTVTRPLGYN